MLVTTLRLIGYMWYKVRKVAAFCNPVLQQSNKVVILDNHGGDSSTWGDLRAKYYITPYETVRLCYIRLCYMQ